MTFFRWRFSLAQHLLALTLALFAAGATTAQAQAPAANPQSLRWCSLLTFDRNHHTLALVSDDDTWNDARSSHPRT